jgi:hypothetical protein
MTEVGQTKLGDEPRRIPGTNSKISYTIDGVRGLEVTHVNPGIGAVFGALNDGQGLMVGPKVLGIGVLVQYRRPQQDTAPLGLDRLYEYQ